MLEATRGSASGILRSFVVGVPYYRIGELETETGGNRRLCEYRFVGETNGESADFEMSIDDKWYRQLVRLDEASDSFFTEHELPMALEYDDRVQPASTAQELPVAPCNWMVLRCGSRDESAGRSGAPWSIEVSGANVPVHDVLEALAKGPVSRFTMRGRSLSAAEWDALCMHGVLADLCMERVHLDAEASRSLAKLSGVQALVIHQCEVSAEGTAAIARLAQLRSLILLDCVIANDAHIDPILRHDGLVALGILDSDVADLHFRGSLVLRELESLSIQRAAVTNATLATGISGERLRSLSLGRTLVSSGAARYLLPLSGMAHLDLTGTNVDDEDVAQLAQFKMLRTLSVRNARLTADGVARLRDALPDCCVMG